MGRLEDRAPQLLPEGRDPTLPFFLEVARQKERNVSQGEPEDERQGVLVGIRSPRRVREVPGGG